MAVKRASQMKHALDYFKIQLLANCISQLRWQKIRVRNGTWCVLLSFLLHLAFIMLIPLMVVARSPLVEL